MDNTELTIGKIINDSEARKQYLINLEQSIMAIFINNTLWDEDTRNAALTASKALRYLYTPPEKEIIVEKKPSWEEWCKNGH